MEDTKELVSELAEALVVCLQYGKKILVCGNGGSAAMADHFVGELVGKFEKERIPLAAISLNNIAVITAVANDYDYDQVFARQVQALGKPDDVLIVLSTSGKSKNCLTAIKTAQLLHMTVLDWPRTKGSTAQVQEFQLKLIHEVCRLVETAFV